MPRKWSKDLVQEIKMYQSAGWDIDEETPEYVLLKRNTSTGGGHLLVFLLTVWWTFGIGNLVYYLMCNEKKKIMK